MPSIRNLAALAAAMSVATVAEAHHSFAPHFDIKKPVSISGKVVEFEARNPHPALLRPGTPVRIEGSRSRTDAHRCFFTDVYFPDGRALNVNGLKGAQPAPVSLAARRDITGTWLLAPNPGRGTSDPQPMMAFLTNAGKAAVARYDPFKDDPAFRCDPVRPAQRARVDFRSDGNPSSAPRRR